MLMNYSGDADRNLSLAESWRDGLVRVDEYSQFLSLSRSEDRIVMVVDGQKWDVSDLDSSDSIKSRSLYPKPILEQEVEKITTATTAATTTAHNTFEMKHDKTKKKMARSGDNETTIFDMRRKPPPPRNMTLTSAYISQLYQCGIQQYPLPPLQEEQDPNHQQVCYPEMEHQNEPHHQHQNHHQHYQQQHTAQYNNDYYPEQSHQPQNHSYETHSYDQHEHQYRDQVDVYLAPLSGSPTDCNYDNSSNNSNRIDRSFRRHPSSFDDSRSTSSGSFSADDESHLEEEILMIEVVPGMEVELRGSRETRRAIRSNAILQLGCLECTVQLHCIQDAKYVLCPVCRCVSPIFSSCTTEQYGVGLGFQRNTTS